MATSGIRSAWIGYGVYREAGQGCLPAPSKVFVSIRIELVGCAHGKWTDELLDVIVITCCCTGCKVHTQASLGCPSTLPTLSYDYQCLGSQPFRSVLSAPNDIGLSPQQVRLSQTEQDFLLTDIREVNVPEQKSLPIIFSGAAGNPVQECPAILMMEAFIMIRIADSFPAEDAVGCICAAFFVTATREGTDLGLILFWSATFLRASRLQAS